MNNTGLFQLCKANGIETLLHAISSYGSDSALLEEAAMALKNVTKGNDDVRSHKNKNEPKHVHKNG